MSIFQETAKVTLHHARTWSIKKLGSYLLKLTMAAKEEDITEECLRDYVRAILLQTDVSPKSRANRLSDVSVVFKANSLPDSLPNNIQQVAELVRNINSGRIKA